MRYFEGGRGGWVDWEDREGGKVGRWEGSLQNSRSKRLHSFPSSLLSFLLVLYSKA